MLNRPAQRRYSSVWLLRILRKLKKIREVGTNSGMCRTVFVRLNDVDVQMEADGGADVNVMDERQFKAFLHLRNRKHVPCFYRVIETRVEVWVLKYSVYKLPICDIFSSLLCLMHVVFAIFKGPLSP